MIMRIVESAQEWDAFLCKQTGEAARSLLLQSWQWLAFQQSFEGLPVYRFFVEDQGSIVAAVGMSVRRLGFGKTILFSAAAPVLRPSADSKVIYDTIAQSPEVRTIARRHSALFWRFAPVQQFDTQWLAGVHPVPDIEPSLTSMIDLSQSEEGLLAAMKSKTRYNIRLSKRKAVTVDFIDGEHTDWKEWAAQYYTLLQETNNRHGISAYPQAYYETMFHELGSAGMLKLAVGKHGGDVIAINIILRFGKTTTYLHGASTHAKKNVMAPYALQWESIQRAKESGAEWYDFYGIAPQDEPQHKLAGVTRFKRGFAGEDVQYAGMFEYPLSRAWYTVYRMINHLRK